jgi:hypothetical protein
VHTHYTILNLFYLKFKQVLKRTNHNMQDSTIKNKATARAHEVCVYIQNETHKVSVLRMHKQKLPQCSYACCSSKNPVTVLHCNIN